MNEQKTNDAFDALSMRPGHEREVDEITEENIDRMCTHCLVRYANIGRAAESYQHALFDLFDAEENAETPPNKLARLNQNADPTHEKLLDLIYEEEDAR